MRARTSVTANKALMNSERYWIIAARHAFAAVLCGSIRVVDRIWVSIQCMVCIRVYIGLPDVYVCASCIPAYILATLDIRAK